jgi:hypothetical protein
MGKRLNGTRKNRLKESLGIGMSAGKKGEKAWMKRRGAAGKGGKGRILEMLAIPDLWH